jgi:hypothetical protein
MSPQDSTSRRGVMVPQAKNDTYTGLLAISLVAILIAIVCLLLEMQTFQWDFRAKDASAAVTVFQPLELASVETPQLLG